MFNGLEYALDKTLTKELTDGRTNKAATIRFMEHTNSQQIDNSNMTFLNFGIFLYIEHIIRTATMLKC